MVADSNIDFRYRRWDRVKAGLFSKLIDFVFDELDPTIFADGWKVFLPDEWDLEFDPESPMNVAFFPWFYFTWEIELKPMGSSEYAQTTIAELFVEEKRDSITEDEKTVLSSFIGQPYSLCQIVDVRPGKSLTLSDLLRHKKYDVTEPQISEVLEPGHIVYCASAELDGLTSMIGFGSYPLASSAKREISRLRKWILDQLESDEITAEALKEFEHDIRGVYFDSLVQTLKDFDRAESKRKSSTVTVTKSVDKAWAAGSASESSSKPSHTAPSGGATVKLKTTFDLGDDESFATDSFVDPAEENEAEIQQSLQFMANEGAAAVSRQLSRAQKPKQQDRVASSPSASEELLDPSSVQCLELFKLAEQIYENAPWQFMEETDVFGCQDPETGEVGFISVMGGLGQYKAVAVYRGEEAFHKWREFVELVTVDPENEEAHDMLLEIPQLQLAFCSTKFLETRDREMIKKSELKFGKDKPVFRSYRPGYLPWFPTQAEARQLKWALEQTLAVARQFSLNPDIIPINEDPEDDEYLIRVPHIEEESVRWENRVRQVKIPNPLVIPFGVEETTVAELNKLQKVGSQEVDLFSLPAKLGGPNERPRLLYALLVTDSETGMVCGFELLEAVDGVELMYASVAEKAAAIWLRNGTIPAELRGSSARLLDMFQHVAGEVGISLSLLDSLPTIGEARKFLIESMESGRG